MLTQKIWSIAQYGAEWVLYVLVFLSFLSIALMVERFIFFFRYRVKVDLLRHELKSALSQGGVRLALSHFAGRDDPESRVLVKALEAAEGGSAAIEEVAAGERGQQKLRLERGLTFLGTLGNNAPFIGLFGTVLGIINAFRELGHAEIQQAGPRIMAAISEALVATAVGLVVAIPAVIAFNYFQQHLKRVLTQTDTLVHELQAFVKSEEANDPLFESPVLLDEMPSKKENSRPSELENMTKGEV